MGLRDLQQVTDAFTRAVRAALGKRAQAVILYGSVARGEAQAGSDVDVLVIGAGPGPREDVFKLAYEVMESTGFEIFLDARYLSREEFLERIRRGSPFLMNALKEGVVLYDDGTFARLREGVPAGR